MCVTRNPLAGFDGTEGLSGRPGAGRVVLLAAVGGPTAERLQTRGRAASPTLEDPGPPRARSGALGAVRILTWKDSPGLRRFGRRSSSEPSEERLPPSAVLPRRVPPEESPRSPDEAGPPCPPAEEGSAP